jgi:mono/diheme cytochrome c family protein
MRFLRDALITIVVLLVVVWVVAYAAVASGGLSAEDQPGALERTLARRLVRLSIPADASRQTNPAAANPTAWRDAADHFADHCAVCHGADGRAQTEIGRYMYPKVPDLSRADIQRMSDGELFYVIQNGVRWTGMPGWKSEHSADETWKLVSFVRHVPSLTEEELKSLGSHGEEQAGHEHQHK